MNFEGLSQVDLLGLRAELMGLPEDKFYLYTWRIGWLTTASQKQKPPPPDDPWTIWFLRGGRGSGKTRVGAEETGWYAATHDESRTLVCAPTAADLRDTCFEGESGLLSVIPRELVDNYNRSLSELVLKNGAILKGIPASEPDRLRGPQWHRVWFDEMAAAQYAQDAFDMIMFALRLGDRPRMIITTTPKPKPIIVKLAKRAKDRKDVVMTVLSTYDNKANLPASFFTEIAAYEGTTLGRQEIHADIIDPEESGIVKRSWMPLWPAGQALPPFDFVLLSYDTAFTQKTVDKDSGDRDPTACLCFGIFKWGIEKVPRAMIIDAWHDWLGFPELRRRVMTDARVLYGPLKSGRRVDLIVIEDEGSGKSLRQELMATGIQTDILAYNPGKMDKLARLHLTSPLVKQGLVWLVESENNRGKPKSWYDPMVSEVCAFHGEGTTEHDDYVDSFTQGLRVLRDMHLLKLPTIPQDLIEKVYRANYTLTSRENPYTQ